MNVTIIRTFESFDIEWYEHGVRVSTWTNYERDEAERVVAYRARDLAFDGRVGRIVRRTWEVGAPEGSRLHQMMRPGIAERREVWPS